MHEPLQRSRLARAISRAIAAFRDHHTDLRNAWRIIVIRHHRALRLLLAAIWFGTIPVVAHAGIWNGGLCTVYQDVLDNELLEVVSLSALVGSIVLWLLDDGRSNIKTHVLRGVLGTLAILNMPLLWAQVFNHGAACTGSI
ncbi:hypothetical protein [Burkholderia multivorans]|uniref:hypothetical protein n=1 Tax=Burkholderia multivorans TaxID=87883 RepID=UPI0021C0032F|nr:hypothetical protein [Burkholderia multivorans]MDR8761975.1 hypothetical protein [Burkholderia multivorans]MDR8766224.1 hypothetical protein [Burkholderia multivorans]MDR8769988.1 hypothetical protein [Burkholderia multivorans]MDR8792056.1 hypothetical protein [Burkholderia multivorans]MDR8794543.1 hypothetical protein [Burkholderia multivorans]